ncbi:MAG TPA: IS21 family transposase [Acidimicrobiia bacterium]|nr:IS21 family transposase [Acidimicrobiia bacterium]
MLKVEDWAEIRRLYRAEDLSINEIVRRLGVSRNTVRAVVRSDSPPEFNRKPRPSAVDPFEGEIRRLLSEYPRMPTTVIAERVGWSRGMTILQDRVRELRPLFVPPDPSGRTEYRPGELAQWDLWFPPTAVPLEDGSVAKPPVLVGVTGYSRVMVGEMIPSREAHDILSAHLHCLGALGGVPRKGVYDNEAALVSRHGGKATLTVPFQRFRGTLGMGVVILRPGDPEAKGLVERANGYLETSFLPGRRFSSPVDFNTQLTVWLEKANNRIHHTLRCRPSDRLFEDRKAMMAFPPVLPDPALRLSVRLPRDHWVRVGTCDYSVHPKAIGRRVEVRVDPTEVVISLAGEVVGRHRRSYARHRTVTDPDHVRAAQAMRVASATWTGMKTETDEVEVRDLAVYDRLTGVA